MFIFLTIARREENVAFVRKQIMWNRNQTLPKPVNPNMEKKKEKYQFQYKDWWGFVLFSPIVATPD